MTNLKTLKTTISALVLSLALCESALGADCAEDEVKGVNTGKCIKKTDSCGTDCTYTIDSQGYLNITGDNGSIKSEFFKNNKDIINVEISGISSIGIQAFKASNIEHISFKTPVNSMSYSVFEDATKLKELDLSKVTRFDERWLCNGCTGLEKIYFKNGYYGSWWLTGSQKAFDVSTINNTPKLTLFLPEDITGFIDGNVSYNKPLANNTSNGIYCTNAQVDSGLCSSNVTRYENDNGKFVIYNDNGSIKAVYDSYESAVNKVSLEAYEGISADNKRIVWSSEGTSIFYGENLLQTYDSNGTMRYVRGNDGLDYYFDSKGILNGATKRGPFTIPEANALTKDGPVNTVTFQW